MTASISAAHSWMKPLRHILSWLFLIQPSTALPQLLGLDLGIKVMIPSTCTDGAGSTYPHGSNFTYSQRDFQLICGVDILQVELTAFVMASLPICVDACVGSPYCVTATYDRASQRCSLKGQQGVPAVVDGLVTAVLGPLVLLNTAIALLPLNLKLSRPSLPSVQPTLSIFMPSTPWAETSSTFLPSASPSRGPVLASPSLLPSTPITDSNQGAEYLLDLLASLGVDIELPPGVATPIKHTPEIITATAAISLEAPQNTLRPKFAYDINRLVYHLILDLSIYLPYELLFLLGLAPGHAASSGSFPETNIDPEQLIHDIIIPTSLLSPQKPSVTTNRLLIPSPTLPEATEGVGVPLIDASGNLGLSPIDLVSVPRELPSILGKSTQAAVLESTMLLLDLPSIDLGQSLWLPPLDAISQVDNILPTVFDYPAPALPVPYSEVTLIGASHDMGLPTLELGAVLADLLPTAITGASPSLRTNDQDQALRTSPTELDLSLPSLIVDSLASITLSANILQPLPSISGGTLPTISDDMGIEFAISVPAVPIGSLIGQSLPSKLNNPSQSLTNTNFAGNLPTTPFEVDPVLSVIDSNSQLGAILPTDLLLPEPSGWGTGPLVSASVDVSLEIPIPSLGLEIESLVASLEPTKVITSGPAVSNTVFPEPLDVGAGLELQLPSSNIDLVSTIDELLPTTLTIPESLPSNGNSFFAVSGVVGLALGLPDVSLDIGSMLEPALPTLFISPDVSSPSLEPSVDPNIDLDLSLILTAPSAGLDLLEGLLPDIPAIITTILPSENIDLTPSLTLPPLSVGLDLPVGGIPSGFSAIITETSAIGNIDLDIKPASPSAILNVDSILGPILTPLPMITDESLLDVDAYGSILGQDVESIAGALVPTATVLESESSLDMGAAMSAPGRTVSPTLGAILPTRSAFGGEPLLDLGDSVSIPGLGLSSIVGAIIPTAPILESMLLSDTGPLISELPVMELPLSASLDVGTSFGLSIPSLDIAPMPSVPLPTEQSPPQILPLSPTSPDALDLPILTPDMAPTPALALPTGSLPLEILPLFPASSDREMSLDLPISSLDLALTLALSLPTAPPPEILPLVSAKSDVDLLLDLLIPSMGIASTPNLALPTALPPKILPLLTASSEVGLPFDVPTQSLDVPFIPSTESLPAEILPLLPTSLNLALASGFPTLNTDIASVIASLVPTAHSVLEQLLTDTGSLMSAIPDLGIILDLPTLSLDLASIIASLAPTADILPESPLPDTVPPVSATLDLGVLFELPTPGLDIASQVDNLLPDVAPLLSATLDLVFPLGTPTPSPDIASLEDNLLPDIVPLVSGIDLGASLATPIPGLDVAFPVDNLLPITAPLVLSTMEMKFSLSIPNPSLDVASLADILLSPVLISPETLLPNAVQLVPGNWDPNEAFGSPTPSSVIPTTVVEFELPIVSEFSIIPTSHIDPLVAASAELGIGLGAPSIDVGSFVEGFVLPEITQSIQPESNFQVIPSAMPSFALSPNIIPPIDFHTSLDSGNGILSQPAPNVVEASLDLGVAINLPSLEHIGVLLPTVTQRPAFVAPRITPSVLASARASLPLPVDIVGLAESLSGFTLPNPQLSLLPLVRPSTFPGPMLNAPLATSMTNIPASPSIFPNVPPLAPVSVPPPSYFSFIQPIVSAVDIGENVAPSLVPVSASVLQSAFSVVRISKTINSFESLSMPLASEEASVSNALLFSPPLPSSTQSAKPVVVLPVDTHFLGETTSNLEFKSGLSTNLLTFSSPRGSSAVTTILSVLAASITLNTVGNSLPAPAVIPSRPSSIPASFPALDFLKMISDWTLSGETSSSTTVSNSLAQGAISGPAVPQSVDVGVALPLTNGVKVSSASSTRSGNVPIPFPGSTIIQATLVQPSPSPRQSTTSSNVLAGALPKVAPINALMTSSSRSIATSTSPAVLPMPGPGLPNLLVTYSSSESSPAKGPNILGKSPANVFNGLSHSQPAVGNFPPAPGGFKSPGEIPRQGIGGFSNSDLNAPDSDIGHPLPQPDPTSPAYLWPHEANDIDGYDEIGDWRDVYEADSEDLWEGSDDVAPKVPSSCTRATITSTIYPSWYTPEPIDRQEPTDEGTSGARNLNISNGLLLMVLVLVV